MTSGVVAKTAARPKRVAQGEAKALAGDDAIATLPPFSLDIGRVVNNLNSAFNPLHRDCLLDYNVAGARDGFVCLQIVIPEGMTKAYIAMLESMTGLFRCIDVKARSAVAVEKSYDPDRIFERKQAAASFSETVCALFDSLIHEGMTVNEAIKRTNLTLKAQGNVWTTYGICTDILRKEGRFRKPKSKKKGDIPKSLC